MFCFVVAHTSIGSVPQMPRVLKPQQEVHSVQIGECISVPGDTNSVKLSVNEPPVCLSEVIFFVWFQFGQTVHALFSLWTSAGSKHELNCRVFVGLDEEDKVDSNKPYWLWNNDFLDAEHFVTNSTWVWQCVLYKPEMNEAKYRRVCE